ncbi:DUF1819 family protein [Leucobacter insecticola]|uniref:DUF1819 family protein n=1 Tax=Leucobacter insecticola TaxID=2714934 RepID=A0A6G8FGD5_9MICO|nr:DUF1819 family protein [Leucobacter insecticola]QIM15461.1 DUF1819 family protein [Leucobacter insecticola]
MTEDYAERYTLSFTTGGLLAREADVLVPLYLRSRDWTAVRRQTVAENPLQISTTSALTRITRELVQRLSVLTPGELEFFDQASPTERTHIMWLAVCHRYTFIAEFAEEVLRERFLTMNRTLDLEVFDRFIIGKGLWHPELDELAMSTRVKLRANLFRMMREAGFLTESGDMMPAILSPSVTRLLQAHHPSAVRFFPAAVSSEVST